MSKDPASKDGDLKDDAAEAAKLRRRRKGGLRVPEDNVPRPTAVAAPPEEARLAVAYAFDDRRPTIDDAIAQQEAMRGFGDDLEMRTTEPSAPRVEDGDGAADRTTPLLGDEVTTAELPLLDDEEAVESDTPRPDGAARARDGHGAQAAPPDADAVPRRIPRASTVALSETDLEEFDDADPSFDLVRAEVRARLNRANRDTESDDPDGASRSRTPRDSDPIDESWDSDGTPEPIAAKYPRGPTDAALDRLGAGDDMNDDDAEEVDLRSEPHQALEPVDRSGSASASGSPVATLAAAAATPHDDARHRRPSTEPPPPPTRPAGSSNGGAASAGKSKPPPAPAPTAARAAAVAAAVTAPESRRSRRRGKPWFEEIFDEDYLRTLPFLTPQATQLEANFVMETLTIEPGSQVLDVGCGYGRHAMELAARGYHVVGLDSSLPLLLRGADEAQRRGLSINFVHGDMREINFDSQFDGAYCLFSTFGFFDDETNKKTAQNIARALKPGARCVIEVLNRDYVISDLPSRVWWEGDGCVVLEEVDFNYFSSRVVSNRSVVFDDGRQLEQEISLRSFSLHELGKLLHTAGFRVVEVSGSMLTRGRFFGAHSRDIVVVAERRVDKTDAPR